MRAVPACLLLCLVLCNARPSPIGHRSLKHAKYFSAAHDLEEDLDSVLTVKHTAGKALAHNVKATHHASLIEPSIVKEREEDEDAQDNHELEEDEEEEEEPRFAVKSHVTRSLEVSTVADAEPATWTRFVPTATNQFYDVSVSFTLPIARDLTQTELTTLTRALKDFAFSRRNANIDESFRGRSSLIPGAAHSFEFRITYRGQLTPHNLRKQLATNPKDLGRALLLKDELADVAALRFNWHRTYRSRSYEQTVVKLEESLYSQDFNTILSSLGDAWAAIVEASGKTDEELRAIAAVVVNKNEFDELVGFEPEDRDNHVLLTSAMLDAIHENEALQTGIISIAYAFSGYGAENVFALIDSIELAEPTATNAQLIHDRFVEKFNFPSDDKLLMLRLVLGCVNEAGLRAVGARLCAQKGDTPLPQGLVDATSSEKLYFSFGMMASEATWQEEYKAVLGRMGASARGLVKKGLSDQTGVHKSGLKLWTTSITDAR